MAAPPRSAPGGGTHGPRARTRIEVAGVFVLAVAVVAASVLVGVYIGSQRSPAASGPSSQPTATGAPAPRAGFGSGPFTGGSPIGGQLTSVGSVRTASQGGYDRFVIDLGQSPLQEYSVSTQPSARFTLDPRGEVVGLDGARGVLIVLRNASNHDSFTGATDVHPGLSAIRETRLVGDFEGVVSWALGVDGPGFVRLTILTGPNRLAVDVQT